MSTKFNVRADANDALSGDDCLSARDDRLYMEDVNLTEVADRFGTPLYVISEHQLRCNARATVAAFSDRWSEGSVLVMPSIKANFALALRYILNEEGMGCDTFGPGELDAALRTGVDPDRISLNGSTKDRELLERAVRAGVRITLDSLAELELARDAAHTVGKPAEVRLRLKPWLGLDQPTDFSSEPVPISLAVQRYKPGIPTEQLLGITRESIAGPEVNVRGVMAHIGRQGRDPAIWAELASQVAALVGQLAEAWKGWRPCEIDIGGGFPVPRDPFAGGLGGDQRRVPAVADYAEAITTALRKGLAAAGVPSEGIQLEVEPGRRLYGNAGVHLTRVRHVKMQTEPVPLRWVETDTSEIFVADVVFEGNRWTALVANSLGRPPTQTADIVGVSCNADVIVPEAALPDVEADDLIVLLDTGAYQDASASNFNALPRPATVLVAGNHAEVIKRAETVDDVFARDRIPKRFGGSTYKSTGAVIGLDHVSVSCSDLERSLDFYADLLGIPVRARGESDAGDVAAITGVEAPVRYADLDLGDGRTLELLQYVTPEARRSDSRFFDPGAGHLSLRVENAAEVHAVLVESGATVHGEPIELTEPGYWNGARLFYAADPDGATVEILERP